MNKKELANYAADLFMDDDNCPISKSICNFAKAYEVNHKQAVDKLAKLALLSGADKRSVEKAVIEIDSELINTYTHIGDEMYFQGFIEAAGLMGVHITRADIQAGIDKENEERSRAIMARVEKEKQNRKILYYKLPADMVYLLIGDTVVWNSLHYKEAAL